MLLCGAISAYDNTLNFITMDSLKDLEENPVAKVIIQQSSVCDFIMLKAISTLIAVLLMIRLVYTRYRIAIIPVFFFQLWLFCYLSFYSTEKIVSEDTFMITRLFIEFLGEAYSMG